MRVYLPEAPHFQQTRDGTCLEACVCIVLAYLGSPVTEDKVCALFDADPEGTPASRVRRLHRWHFQVTYSRASLADLHQWLQQGSLPIVFVETGFLDHWQNNVRHALVVVGLDDSTIWLHDPAFEEAPQRCLINGFLAAWAEMDEATALITIQT